MKDRYIGSLIDDIVTLKQQLKESEKVAETYRKMSDTNFYARIQAENKLQAYKSTFSVFELNGILADAIIEVTEDIFNNDILNLFEKVARIFETKITSTIQELDSKD